MTDRGPPPRAPRRDPRAAQQPPWHSLPPALPVEIRPPPAPGSLPQVRPASGFEALAGFLESDLQGGLHGLERLLAQLDRVAAGGVGGFQRTGNAYSLRLLRDQAIIHPLGDDIEPDCRLELAVLRRVLLAWRAALGS